MKLSKLAAAISVAAPLAIASPLASAEDDAFLIESDMGKINLDLRVRYEGVNDDSPKKDAEAFTARVRLGYLTPDFAGFKAFAELESTVSLLSGREYNDKTLNPGSSRGKYSVIADPDNNELNRAWVSYSGFADSLIKLGRQRIIFDNARFVGNVGWRQNEQTFDALTFANTSFADTTIVAGYVNDVHTILGTHVEAEVPVVNIKYSGLPFGDIIAYGYYIDFDDNAATDRDTIGLRFTGSTNVSESVKTVYTAEYAQQDADKRGTSKKSLDYYMLEAGATFTGVTAKVARESHEGNKNAGVAFDTPLGTNHAFSGWADQFLVIPTDGLEDTFFTLSTKLAGVKLAAIYHDFEADDSGVDYGDEIDFLVAKKFGKNYSLLLKYAKYERGDRISGKVDTDKLWVQGEVKF
ncbi:MAG: hypothetical protein DRQ61_11765 [Gammaproteobacteria bacterium]|nr:MAG: hypothetical protein DRQ61_11765 [Gammaproteobacteria bacterium]